MPPGDELEELGNTFVTSKDDLDLNVEVDADAQQGHLHMVVLGNGSFATHPVRDGAVLTIGRSPRCEITIDDKSISRRHATLKIGGDALTIEDLGSANGTIVRGNRIKPEQQISIAVGELVGLGDVNIILQRRTRPMRARRLWTHDYFEARLEEECARVYRVGAPFALLHIYPDRRSRDSFIEETLAELVRESDVLGKYGPHEYEVLLPDTPPNNAEEAMRLIESRLLERGLKCRLFIACCPRDGSSPYQLVAKVQAQATNGTPITTSSDIIVSDPQMRSLHRMVEQIAGSQINVLILGETGVGKEVFARTVHSASPRARGPFVEINCAALTETLLESELFGHEKGAFTNAVAAKPGLIEMAHGGTLLLDEIGEMPLATQAKLLRVIEDAQIRRVGGLKSRAIDIRIVAATNSDLETQAAAGEFRRDLFYRLNAVTIVIPPLRERVSEIEPLAQAFIARARPHATPQLTADALNLMKGYSWPGNVRELKNVVERAVLLSGDGPIRLEHLPVEKMRAMVMPGEPVRAQAPLRGSDEEEQWIMQALESSRGNQTQAARLLGISRRTLVNRLNEFQQIHRPRKHAAATKKKKKPDEQ